MLYIGVDLGTSAVKLLVMDEYSFETADSSDVSVYDDTGSGDGCL